MNFNFYILLALQLYVVYAATEAFQEADYVQIEGLVANPPGINREEFFTACRVLVDGGQHIAFLRYVFVYLFQYIIFDKVYKIML